MIYISKAQIAVAAEVMFYSQKQLARFIARFSALDLTRCPILTKPSLPRKRECQSRVLSFRAAECKKYRATAAFRQGWRAKRKRANKMTAAATRRGGEEKT